MKQVSVEYSRLVRGICEREHFCECFALTLSKSSCQNLVSVPPREVLVVGWLVCSIGSLGHRSRFPSTRFIVEFFSKDPKLDLWGLIQKTVYCCANCSCCHFANRFCRIIQMWNTTKKCAPDEFASTS